MGRLDEAKREMTFEEEYEILLKEKDQLFATEIEGDETPFPNCVVRRALRCIRKLKERYIDAEEQGLILRLDSKDKLIEVLATKLLNSEFGRCYMCTNPMKNITLDGVNNGCDGGCNTSEEFTVDEFLKKITDELSRKEQKSEDTEEV